MVGHMGVARKDDAQRVYEDMKRLAQAEILVGFPEGGPEREETDGPTNAQLAYIHDRGAPEANIPARPFMVPGIEENMGAIERRMRTAAKQILREKNPLNAAQVLTRVGITAVVGIKRKINEGIPPPLSDYTLRKRAERGTKGRKGAKIELLLRSFGEAPSTEHAKPLIDTGQMRNAVTYVLRRRRDRK